MYRPFQCQIAGQKNGCLKNNLLLPIDIIILFCCPFNDGSLKFPQHGHFNYKPFVRGYHYDVIIRKYNQNYNFSFY